MPTLAEQAAAKSWSFAEFAGAADRRAEATLQRRAGFPHRKSLADFDFGLQPSVCEKKLRELAGDAFLEHAENVLLLGARGRRQPPRRLVPAHVVHEDSKSGRLEMR